MNNNDNIDKYTHKLIKEVGLESPSPILMENVMKNISLNRSTITSYKPLISLNAWYLILAFLFSIIILGYILPFKSHPYLSKLKVNFDLSFSDIIPSISISTSIIYVGGFIILFMIQMFYLRNFINRNYQL